MVFKAAFVSAVLLFQIIPSVTAADGEPKRDIVLHKVIPTTRGIIEVPEASISKDMGYINVKRMLRYDEDRLFEYLQKGYPVFLSGAENISLIKSHGWVVDGWYKSFKVYDMKDKATGKITGPHTKLMGDYLHCNWGNASDSWVVAGVFNDTHSTYNTLYRMITYEVPGR